MNPCVIREGVQERHEPREMVSMEASFIYYFYNINSNV